MGWWQKLLGERPEPAEAPLYRAIVVRAREPHWYVAGQVPDTVDGRFDMVAAVLALVLIRMEALPDADLASARLTEQFVDDMDGQLRQIGIGDIVVGKHMGKMMAMLGGRLGAYREALAAGDLRPALLRNLYRAGAPEPAALDHAAGSLTAFYEGLAGTDLPGLMAGRLA